MSYVKFNDDGTIKYSSTVPHEDYEYVPYEVVQVNGHLYKKGTEPANWQNEMLFSSLRAAREARLRNNYDTALAQLSRELRLAENDAERAKITAKIASWDAWAVALCNLPSLSGAPWDGGGESTPWPAAPAFMTAGA